MRQRKASLWQKLSFFIVVAVILAIVAYTAYGIATMQNSYMRFGIDIKGGVSATFQSADDSVNPTDDQLESAKSVIELRLDGNNILDRTVTIDRENKNILVEFPWQANEKDFDPIAAISELGETAQLTFNVVKQAESTDKGAYPLKYDGVTVSHYTVTDKFMTGDHVKEAAAGYLEGEYIVNLEFDSEGAKLFGEKTSKNVGGEIGIMMDDTLISVATVQTAITEGS